MKRRYSQLFVWRLFADLAPLSVVHFSFIEKKHIYTLLFIMFSTAAMAQPPCPTGIAAGRIVVADNRPVFCAGTDLSLTLNGYTADDDALYFIEYSATGDNFQIAGMSPDPANVPFTRTLGEEVAYFRYAAKCKYTMADLAYSDTIKVIGRGMMSGKYTINSSLPASERNFTSFTDALAAMRCAGIDAAVEFNVSSVNGVYKEQLLVPAITGASAINTITFKGNGNTIAFGSNDYFKRAIIRVDDGDYYTFEDFVLDATGGNYGIGVHVVNNADFNTFRRCYINAGSTASFNEFKGVSIGEDYLSSDPTLSDGNLFENNTVVGGIDGMVMVSNNGSDENLIVGNRFINNEVRDFQRNGIKVINTRDAVISGNSISREKRTNLNVFAGIQLEDKNLGTVVSGNRIFNVSTGNTASTLDIHGIRLYFSNATATEPVLVFNNLLYNFDGSGEINALSNSNSSYVRFYHNTVSLRSTTNTSASATRGYYQSTQVAGVDFKNNIIDIRRSGTGAKHAIYLNNVPAATFSSDYNNLYVEGIAGNFIGYINSTSYATLDAWKTASSNDAASISVDPLFRRVEEGVYVPNNALMDNKGVSSVVRKDFADAERNSTNPDIGAYEFAQLDCTAPPIAATVVAAETSICSGENAILTLKGGDLGTGLTYQWQSSTNGTDWANIAAATGRTVTVSQTTNTRYRVLSVCGTGSTPSALVEVSALYAVKGTFKINRNLPTGGDNFASFNDAWNFIKCGINGPVVFNVEPGSGIYREQLLMTPVFGASKDNTITFNGNGNTIAYASGDGNQRAVIMLRGVSHVIFDSLVVDAVPAFPGQFGYGFQLLNNSDSNIIRRCTIKCDTENPSMNYAGIVVNGSATNATGSAADCDFNILERNHIDGGYYGIILSSTNALANLDNKLRGNTITNFYRYGIYLASTHNTLVDSNSISRPTRYQFGEFTGIYADGFQTSLAITRNRIFKPFEANPDSKLDFYGIYFNNADGSAGMENVISNNMIYDINGGANVYGLYNYGSDRAWYLHNTIHLDGATTSDPDIYSTYGFYQDNVAGALRFNNNILSVTRTGASVTYGLYLGNASTGINSDYNNLYIASLNGKVNIGFDGRDRRILTHWQQAGRDPHSISVNPVYADVALGNLEPKNAGIDNLGQAVTDAGNTVKVDVAGNARSATQPDLGAYEFNAPPCTSPVVAGKALTSDQQICESKFVELNLEDYSVGAGQTYTWQSSETETGTYTNVNSGANVPILSFAPAATRYYRAMVTCNGVPSYSDPIQVVVNPALPGREYTIDAGGSGDFRTFNEAKAALSCGIKGPVIFNVLPNSGFYAEQLMLDSVQGASAVNTITFKGNGNFLYHSATEFDKRAAITLGNKASHFIFDSLIIETRGPGSYGWGAFLTQNADSNTFRKCTFNVQMPAYSDDFVGVVIGSSATSATSSINSSYCDHNLFEGNTINGGYYGMVMMGNETVKAERNKFIGNKLIDASYTGIYVGATSEAVIEGNEMYRPNMSGTFKGFAVNGNSNGLLISRNRVHNLFDGNTSSVGGATGIELSGNNAPVDQPTVISNNLFYNFNGVGTIYGIYSTGTSNVKLYHNTFSFDDVNSKTTSSTTTSGIYQIQGTGLDMKNNIFSITRGGLGLKQAFYFSWSGTIFKSDRNIVWLGGAGPQKLWGYYATNHVTLKTWQERTANDSGSVMADPMFKDMAAGNFQPTVDTLDNRGVYVGIGGDIDGANRSTTVPDIGAIEYALTSCTTPPVAGASAATPSDAICMGTNVQLSLAGNSEGASQKYVWQRAASAAGPWTAINDTSYASGLSYELANTDTYFRAVVVCGTGVAYADPVVINMNPALPAGDYTIDPAIATGARNFQTFKEAVAAMQCGIAGSVRFLAAPATYREKVVIPKIPGASSIATVTFTSNDDKAASVVLTAAGTFDSNFVVRFDSARYVTFKNITVKSEGATYARAIEFRGNVSYNTVTGCVIESPKTTSTSTNLAAVFGTALWGTDNKVSKNTITNGSAGVYLAGTNFRAGNIAVDSNHITGSYSHSLYLATIIGVSATGNNIVRSGTQGSSSGGIYISDCDTLYKVDRNMITISNTTVTVYGIYLVSCDGDTSKISSVSGNRVTAVTGNTGSLYGIYFSADHFANLVNNVVAVRTTNATSYGFYSQTVSGANYYNNSVQNASASTALGTNQAAYILPHGGQPDVWSGPNKVVNIKNNIFSHTGGGVALYLSPNFYTNSDYNLFYAAGTVLFRYGVNDVANIGNWRNLTSGDFNSLVYKPSFTDDTLKPALADANAWAMHGRGVQIPGNDKDHLGNNRPVILAAGVPDLGAYEFYPSALPVALTAIPATPVPNSTQTFMLGTDTVTKITWGNDVPSTIQGQRYSGVPPDVSAGVPYMYFYTSFSTTGTAPKGHHVQQFYVDSWKGLMPNEATLKLGKTNNAGVWQTGASEKTDTIDNKIRDTSLLVLNKFTGLTDGSLVATPPVVLSRPDTSNMGTSFWVGYGHHQAFGMDNRQEMALFLAAGKAPAKVTVRVNGTQWVKQYTVPADSSIVTDLIPKSGQADARLLDEGLYSNGISIESDVPVAAFAHIYTTVSGSNGTPGAATTMLLPVGTYGYEYYALGTAQHYQSNAWAWINVVAAYDSTVVEITPSVLTKGGRKAGVPFTVRLSKGQIYQVMGAVYNQESGYDLTGTKLRSLSNESGKCLPFGLFTGSSITAVNCSGSKEGSGDNLIQQAFPYSAWGKKYITTTTAVSNSSKDFNPGIFRIMVRDAATVVKRNGTALAATNLIGGRYYQIESFSGDYIEADKPVAVAQFIPSSVYNICGYVGNGDPEMIYLTPVEKGIKEAVIYKAEKQLISAQYVHLVVPDEGLKSLTIDGSNTFDFTTVHAGVGGYTIVVKRFAAGKGATVIKCDSAFTGITYGFGQYESYAYNLGARVTGQSTGQALENSGAAGNRPFTCAGTPFKLKFRSVLPPERIEWKLSTVAHIKPAVDVNINNPVASGTVVINGVTYYEYTLAGNYVIDTAGEFNVPVVITNGEIDACGSKLETLIPVKVVAAPVVNFSVTGNCAAGDVQFAGAATTSAGGDIVRWNWDFNDAGATSDKQNAVYKFSKTGTYQIKLQAVDQAGCVDDTVKTVTIGAGPAVVAIKEAQVICPGSSATMEVKDPVKDAIYTWYEANTGGSAVSTGNSYTVTNASTAVSYWIESSLNGCISAERKKVTVTIAPPLTAPDVKVLEKGVRSLSFGWTAVTDATGYEVSVDNGGWITPSSGITGLTHIVNGLTLGQTVSLKVRVLGGCTPVESVSVKGTTETDEVWLPNSFSPNNSGPVENEYFKVYGNAIKQMHLMIFSQWGEKLFESTNQSQGWDGRYKGKPQPSGVYIYVVDVILNDNKRVTKKGSINLVR